jgi:hypothetical protein
MAEITAPETRWRSDMGRSASWGNIAYCLAAAENADRNARRQNRQNMRRFNGRLAAEYRKTAFSLAGGDPGLRREIERALAHAQPRANSGPLTKALNMLGSVALARLKMLVWTGPAAFLIGFIIEIIRVLVTGRLSVN